ncbi:MAG: hypothetical protein KDD64_10935, partial [Bdellovibrionales bacterium]|nr:hypothetical protein [Bdellovibrionales bacterium]
ALHPDALVQNPMSSADQAKARERFLVHVVQALSNLKQNPQDKAVSTKEPNGVSEAQAPDSNKLHLEQTGELRESLWIVKCAFLHARENESLVRGMFAACTKDPEFFLNTLLDDSIFKNTLWVAYILSRKFSAISEALKEFPEIQLVFDVATKSPLKPEGVSAFVRYLPYSGAR